MSSLIERTRPLERQDVNVRLIDCCSYPLSSAVVWSMRETCTWLLPPSARATEEFGIDVERPAVLFGAVSVLCIERFIALQFSPLRGSIACYGIVDFTLIT